MSGPDEVIARLGARLGNWNDRRFGRDVAAEASWVWRTLDRLAAAMFLRGSQ